ncbi:MAG TPA: RNA polymerase sigma factor [Bryobacteraceae bacterium]|nr:RNA polymerase sigma factor [Bryobacteraceae bacterium]
MPEERADNIIMQKVRDGDLAKMAVLFERHHRALFRYFLRLTGNREFSEDLVQDVYFRMLKYRHSYRDGSLFTSWMYQVARHAHLDGVQKRKGEAPLFEVGHENTPEPASTEPDPGELLRRRQDLGLLRRALAALPVEKRELLVLSRFQNLKYEQIADILACDVGTVKVRVYRAIKALSEVFFELAGEKAS